MTALTADGWAQIDGIGGFRCEVDFGGGWANVTAWVTGAQIVRGRSGPLARFDAGQATVELRNTAGRFSPWSTNTPWGAAGTRWVHTNNRVRILGRSTAGGQRTLFVGWVDAWDEQAHGRWAPGTVTLTATDGFKMLSQANRVPVTPVGADELTGARVARILTSAGWSSTERRIDTGSVPMQATDLSDGALDELHDVALSEGGALWVDAAGRVVFYDRARLAETVAPLATFTNTGQPFPFVSIDPASDDRAIVNVVRIGCVDGAASTVVDDDSVTAHGQRVFDRTDLLHRDDADSSDLAALLLTRAALAEFRIAHLEVVPQAALPADRAGTWTAVLRLDLLDPVRVIFKPADAAYGMAVSARLDGLVHRITPGYWTVDYQIAVPSTIDDFTVIDPITDLTATRFLTHLTWTWSNAVGDYDYIQVQFDSGDWITLSGTVETFTASGLEVDTEHTLCVKGHLDGFDTDVVCDTARTLSLLDPGVTCEWRWTLYQLTGGITELDDGTYTANLNTIGWRPTYAYVPLTWYRLCFEKWCGTPKEMIGDPDCVDWQQELDTGPPCVYDTPPDPVPIFSIEVCGPTGEMQDAVTEDLVFRDVMFRGPQEGPYGTDHAILTGPGTDPGRFGWAALADTARMGTGPIEGEDPTTNMGFTFAAWVKLSAVPTVAYNLVSVGTEEALALTLYPTDTVTRAGIRRINWIGVSSLQGFPEEEHYDTIPMDDDWHSVAITYGSDPAEGGDGWIKLYVDGVYRGGETLDAAYLIREHDALVRLAGTPDDGYAHIAGWGQVLSAAEIGDIYVPPIPTYTGDFVRLDQTSTTAAFYQVIHDIGGGVYAGPAADITSMDLRMVCRFDPAERVYLLSIEEQSNLMLQLSTQGDGTFFLGAVDTWSPYSMLSVTPTIPAGITAADWVWIRLAHDGTDLTLQWSPHNDDAAPTDWAVIDTITIGTIPVRPAFGDGRPFTVGIQLSTATAATGVLDMRRVSYSFNASSPVLAIFEVDPAVSGDSILADTGNDIDYLKHNNMTATIETDP